MSDDWGDNAAMLELCQARDRIAELESKLEACEKDRDHYRTTMHAVDQDGDSAWDRVKELENRLERAEAEERRLRKVAQDYHTVVDRLEVVSKEVEAMEALLEKATNDVSAWKSRASGAESRLEGMQLMLDSWREAYRKLTAGDHAEVRLDTDGAIDEVVGSGVFQMEQMDTNRWFFDLAGCKFNIDGKKVTLTPIEVDTWAEEQKRIAVERQPTEREWKQVVEVEWRGSKPVRMVLGDADEKCGICGAKWNEWHDPVAHKSE